MKTAITLVLVFVSTLCLGQNPQEEQLALFTAEQTEKLDGLVDVLSNIVQVLQEKESFFNSQEMVQLKESLRKEENKVNWQALANTIKKLESIDPDTKVSYNIRISDSDRSNTIKDLEEIHFIKLTETLENFVTKFQESPKFKDLQESLLALETELTKE